MIDGRVDRERFARRVKTQNHVPFTGTTYSAQCWAVDRTCPPVTQPQATAFTVVWPIILRGGYVWRIAGVLGLTKRICGYCISCERVSRHAGARRVAGTGIITTDNSCIFFSKGSSGRLTAVSFRLNGHENDCELLERIVFRRSSTVSAPEDFLCTVTPVCSVSSTSRAVLLAFASCTLSTAPKGPKR